MLKKVAHKNKKKKRRQRLKMIWAGTRNIFFYLA